jgi:hypothetical protein
VQDIVNPDDRLRRLDLVLALGVALFPAGDTERVVTQVSPDAFALAEELVDRGLAFRACRLVLDCLLSQSDGWGRASSTAESAYLMWQSVLVAILILTASNASTRPRLRA